MPISLKTLALLVLPLASFAQPGILDGYVNGPDKKGIPNAVVSFDRVDIPSHAEVKTDKNGHYQIFTLMNGDYIVSVAVAGQVRDKAPYHVSPGNQNRPLYFFLKPPGEAPETAAGASPLGNNRQLNELFTAGNKALEAGEFDRAIDSLNKANGIDAKHDAVWSALAEAYMSIARTKPAESAANLDRAFAAFRKAIELKPADAGLYNNFALALAASGRPIDARENLAKAIELDPAGAGKYYFNLGVLLLNIGQTEAAVAQLKHSIEADNYPEAHYQYGMALVMKANTDASGQVIPAPGTVEALQRYLELRPDGPNAKSAKEMIAVFTGKK